MTFGIHATPAVHGAPATYSIVLEGDREGGRLITTFWDCGEYEHQWREALKALSQRRVQSCVLITDIQPPAESYGVMYWAVFRDDSDVFLQERFLRMDPYRIVGRPEDVEARIPPRIQSRDVADPPVSEWRVRFSSVCAFVGLDE